jgi:tellurite resistance protein TerC
MDRAGAALVTQFSWVLYLFGVFLVLTGVKMLWLADHQPDLEKNALLRLLRRYLRVTPTLRGSAFWIREPDPVSGRPVLWATPLLLALALIEFADLVFAVDSVPVRTSPQSMLHQTGSARHRCRRQVGTNGATRC